MPTPRTIPLFLLHAPGDEPYRKALARQLAAFEYGKILKVWHEGKILAGTDREAEIKRRLCEAEIILLLVTAAWTEIGELLDLAIEQQYRGARIIPVVAAPSDFVYAPFRKFQPLPHDERPISTRPDVDQAWLEVAHGVRDAALFMQGTPAALGQRTTPAPQVRAKVLFVAAQSEGGVLLELGRELGEIRESLRDSEGGRGVEVVYPGPVPVAELDRQLLREQPTILHVSGHGDTSGNLLFSGDPGTPSEMTPERLSQLFRILASSGHLRCVVMNACHSRRNAEAAREHVDFVIGTTGAIADAAAIRFASGFYLALGHGEPMKTAFELGCLRAGLAGTIQPGTTREVTGSRPEPAPATPVLLCRDGADPAKARLVS